MQTRLTKREVDSLVAGPKDRILWDRDLKGFGIKITPSNKKIYILQKRLRRSLLRLTIGPHGAPWTPDLARAEATRLLGLLASGQDPRKEKARLSKCLSVQELVRDYREATYSRKKPKTRIVEDSLLRRHILPLLGNCDVLSLTRGHIERFMSQVEGGYTSTVEKTSRRGKAIVRGGKGAANRSFEILSAILQYAVSLEIRSDNPARGISKYALQKRERLLTDAEIKSLADALVHAEGQAQNPVAIAAIRFLLLTGCRKSEALSLRWDWLDLDRGCLRLPDSKTGAKVVSVGKPAIAILLSLKRTADNPFVFPSRREGHFVGLQKVWAKVRQQAQLPTLRLHDLRHHFASVGVSSGESLFIVGKLLGHSQAHTTQRYAHIDSSPLRRSADRISQRILDVIAAHPRSAAA